MCLNLTLNISSLTAPSLHAFAHVCMCISLQPLMTSLVPSASLLSMFVRTTVCPEQLTVEFVMITVTKPLCHGCVFFASERLCVYAQSLTMSPKTQ